MVGFRMAGFMLSGSGIRVFFLGNMGLGWGGWGKVQINDGEGGGVVGMGCGGGRGGGVYCLLEVPEGCNCQVNVLQCTLKGVETCIYMFPLPYLNGVYNYSYFVCIYVLSIQQLPR